MATTPTTLFVARIELHDVGQDHKAYSILHGMMHEAGFDQEASSDDGEYDMPRATYRRWDSTSKGTDTVANLAIAALDKTIAECKKTNVHSELTGSVYTIKSAEPPRFKGLRPVKTK